MVMQDVNHQLFTNSVLSEVLLSMEHPDENEAEKILMSLDLDEYKEKHPMALSGGTEATSSDCISYCGKGANFTF